MNKRVFTEEDRKWLVKFYPLQTAKQCMHHFHCTREKLRELVEDCGMKYRGHKNEKKVKKTPVKPRNKWQDEGATRFCIDCRHYNPNGICGKSMKEVGALWQRKCFK